MSAKELKKREAEREQDYNDASRTNEKFRERQDRERRLFLAAVDLAGRVTKKDEVKHE